MLTPLKKLVKYGGGSVTLLTQKNKQIYKWEIEPMLVVELEKRRWSLSKPYITKINNTDILSDINGNFPILCYNNIIKKWFCTNKSYQFVPDFLVVKKLKQKYSVFNEESGFYSSALEAIIKWNIATALELMSNTFRNTFE